MEVAAAAVDGKAGEEEEAVAGKAEEVMAFLFIATRCSFDSDLN